MSKKNLKPKNPIADPDATIGKQVFKPSGKPFKSTLKFNTVKGVVCNPNTGKVAFTFVEDDSFVDVDKCEEMNEPHKVSEPSDMLTFYREYQAAHGTLFTVKRALTELIEKSTELKDLHEQFLREGDYPEISSSRFISVDDIKTVLGIIE